MANTKGTYVPKGLPFLPGNTFNMQFQESKFHKSHHFDFSNNVPVFDNTKPPIGGEHDPETLRALKRNSTSNYPVDDNFLKQPAWVAFDRQVLRFNAYFQEAVHEKREETYRIRKCIILFYLDDDTVQVNEPKMANSGIPQGTLINRHRVPRPDPQEGESDFYTVDDFNVGREITFYSRTFKITSCDQFTQNFLMKLGIRIGSPEPIPSDPYTTVRTDMLASMRPKRPYSKTDTLKQFLTNDRKVLRFYCCWDDSESVFGDTRDMTLHYFLADDTIEIRETIPSNSGRDAVPQFLKRQKLPRQYNGLNGPGSCVESWYSDRDLAIGASLSIYGRRFILCDCDDFTKAYYRAKFNISDFQPVSIEKLAHMQQGASHVIGSQRQLPPYNGFGSEEDSLGSCVSLVPKPPRKDFNKLMTYDNMVLRFAARLDTQRPIDSDRKFIISFFLADDTLLIFEPKQRNSGIISGKFLERMKIKKPQQDVYYAAHDLFVGASITLQKHKFIITDADEYALKYMEDRPDVYPAADVNGAMAQLRTGFTVDPEKREWFISSLARADPSNTGLIDRSQLLEILEDTGFVIKHEAMTIVRNFSEDQIIARYNSLLNELFGSESTVA